MKKTLMMVAFAGLTLTSCKDTGSGEKIGMVTKLAQQGVFCKTWEGEIVRGGMNGGTGVNGSSFHFTVTDESLVKKVQQAMEGQHEVKISYRTEWITFCSSDSRENAFLTNIEVIDSRKNVDGTSIVDTNDAIILQLLKVQAELISQLYNRSK